MRKRLYTLFFLSGAAGLVYEVVWSRLLRDVFGVTVHAVAAVLATYLAGLALGGWALGRVADRTARPLRWYGLLELGIAAAALLGTLLSGRLASLHDFAALRLAPGSPLLLGIRMLLAAIVVLPATLLMGATLPAMTRVLVDRIGSVGRELSTLYALNTAGAVAGGMAAGFWLIRTAGVNGTLWLAVAVNAGVGLAALFLAARAGQAVPQQERARRPAKAQPGILVAVGLSGIATLALEVIWTRVLALVVGSSTYAFVTVLTAFLVGIALGSAAVRLFAARLRDPRRAFGWLQAGIAAATLGAIPLMSALVTQGQQWVFSLESHWLALTLARFGIAFLIMLVPTTLIGAAFPLAGMLRIDDAGEVGGDLGKVYGAATAGNVAGALLAAFVLLPLAGLQRSAVLVSAAPVASAAWAFLPWRRQPLRALPLFAAGVLWAALLAFWRPAPFTSIEQGPSDPVLFYREGPVATVKVIQRTDDARQRVMLVDGVRIGQSSQGIDNKQQVLAHFPFLLRDTPPARILTIGLGSGIVSGELSRHPGVASIDAVELSPAVIEGAAQFSAFNYDVLHDPKVRIIADDGVNFLRRSPDRYDAIVSDGKSRLGQVGNAVFFAREYYQSILAHLAPHGLVIQWMPLEEVPEDLRIIVRTFNSVFPHAYLFAAQDSCFLVGQLEPLALDLARVQRELDAPATADLRRHGWRDAAELVSLLVATRDSAAAWLGQEDTVDSLDHPILEFYSPRELARPAAERLGENAAALARLRGAPVRDVHLTGLDPGAAQRSGKALGEVLTALESMGHDDLSRVNRELQLLQDAAGAVPSGGVIASWAAAALVRRGAELDQRGESGRAFWMYRVAADAWPESLDAHVKLGAAYAERGVLDEAARELGRALELNPDSGIAHRAMGQLLRQAGRPLAAAEQYREVLRISPGVSDVHSELGQCLALGGQPDAALEQFREAMRLEPEWPAPMAFAAMLLARHPNAPSRNPAEAVRLARQAAELSRWRDRGILEILAVAYASDGKFEKAASVEGKALDLVPANADPGLTAEMRAALDRYQRGQVQ